MTTLASASLHIKPAWLANPPLVLVWVWLHSLAVTCFVIATLDRCSSRAQDLAFIIAGIESSFGSKVGMTLVPN